MSQQNSKFCVVPKRETTRERYLEIYKTYQGIVDEVKDLKMPVGTSVSTEITSISLLFQLETILQFRYSVHSLRRIIMVVNNYKEDFGIADGK